MFGNNLVKRVAPHDRGQTMCECVLQEWEESKAFIAWLLISTGKRNSLRAMTKGNSLDETGRAFPGVLKNPERINHSQRSPFLFLNVAYSRDLCDWQQKLVRVGSQVQHFYFSQSMPGLASCFQYRFGEKAHNKKRINLTEAVFT